MTLPILALGGAGVITVTANVEPARFVALYERFCAGDYAGARDMHYELSPPLMRALFIDTNPIPVKQAVGMRGMASGPLRLPLDCMTEAAEAQLRRCSPAMTKIAICGGASGAWVQRLQTSSTMQTT